MKFSLHDRETRSCMKWLERIRADVPLVECITNVVTVNDVANTILAAGGSPVMGIEKSGIKELVAISSAVVLNIGTVKYDEFDIFHLAIEAAVKQGRPVVLDPVGAGATRVMTDLALELAGSKKCSVIRGNASEMRALLGYSGSTRGVDVSASDVISEDNIGLFAGVARSVAEKYSCIASMSGPIDIISDGNRTFVCRNGVPMMSRVTGTGCSLTGITAAFAGVASAGELLDASAWATAYMGCAGEIAMEKAGAAGLGSFRCALVDALSTMDDAKLETMARLEVLQC